MPGIIAQQQPLTTTSMQDVYLLCEGTNSSQPILLTLNNNNPSAEVVHLELYTKDGRRIALPDVPLEASQSKLIQFDKLLMLQGITETLGYLNVSYKGKLMSTGAQLTLYPSPGEGGLDSARSLAVDFTDTRRVAAAWFPQGATATIALSNVSDARIAVMSQLGTSAKDTFNIKPHATHLLSINADDVSKDFAKVPLFHDVSFTGSIDALRVAGYVAPSSGPPLPLRYYDPAISTTTSLTAVGIDTSAPTHVSVYNTTGTDYTVTAQLRPSTDVATEPLILPPFTVPANSSAYVDVAANLATLASHGSLLSTLTLNTTAPVGAFIGALSEEKQTISAIEDVPLRTGNPAIYMHGYYPLRWTSDYQNTAMVTNTSSVPKELFAYVVAGGVTYNLPPVQLQPFATHVYDIDGLRAKQMPDFKGRVIPLAARSGKFHWAGKYKIPVLGSLEGWRLSVKKTSVPVASAAQGHTIVHPTYITRFSMCLL